MGTVGDPWAEALVRGLVEALVGRVMFRPLLQICIYLINFF
jgi:hypothetical protein